MVAGVVQALARHMGGVAAGRRIPNPDDAARLDRVGDDAVVVETQFDGIRRRGKACRHRAGVARMPFEAQIARHLGGELRRAGSAGGGGAGHRRQRGIIDRHQLGGVERLVAGFGDDQRDRLAGPAHLALGQERLRQKGKGLAGLGVGLGRGPQRL